MNLVRASFILEAMQQAAANYGSTSGSPSARGWPSPSSSVSSFAGLLTSLTSPDRSPEPEWNADDLADDVATLSYERALRAHARYRAADPSDRSLSQPPDPGTLRTHEAFPAEGTPAAEMATPQAAPASSADAEPEVTNDLMTGPDRNLKCASVTIRLSNAECAQLRKRAAEAGLTVSAYLRSCTFEAESLRALVKDTLAQLRSDPSNGNQAACAPVRRSWIQRLAQLWPLTRASQRIAQA